MRIEMVVPSLIRAGMENVTARLSVRLRERGHSVGLTCILGEGAVAEELREQHFRVSFIPTEGRRTLVWPGPLIQHLREQAPDVVHVHSGAWMKGVRAAFKAGVRSILFTEHGLLDVEPVYSGLLKRASARWTHRVVAVSEALRRELVGTFGLPPEKVVVLENGVDTSHFAPGPPTGAVRNPLGLWDAPIVGHVARLAPVKNQPLLVDAFALVRSRIPDAHLVLVGDGEMRSAIDARVQAHGLGDCVHLIGERSDTADVLRDFDLFVLPSKAEGTSMSLLEAMASGVPILATAVGGGPALLANGRAGVLVPANDARALADAMATLLGDAPLRRRLAIAARERVEAHYAEDAVVTRYERLYRDPRCDPFADPMPAVSCAG